MLELGQTSPHPAAPAGLWASLPKSRGPLSDRGAQTELQALGLRRPQGHETHRRTELVRHPAVEVGLDAVRGGMARATKAQAQAPGQPSTSGGSFGRPGGRGQPRSASNPSSDAPICRCWARTSGASRRASNQSSRSRTRSRASKPAGEAPPSCQAVRAPINSGKAAASKGTSPRSSSARIHPSTAAPPRSRPAWLSTSRPSE